MTKWNLKQKIAHFNQIKKDLPIVIANDSKNFFVSSWRKGGFEDETLEKWKEPQRRTPGTRVYNRSNARARSRGILIGKGTGDLRASIRVKTASWQRIVIATDKPYAERHNKGLKGMPKRQFMGRSKKLTQLHLRKIRSRINTYLK